MRLFSVLIVLYLLMAMGSCKKDSFITSEAATIHISDDSLAFDTLFTTSGSVTHFFKLFNNNDQKLKLSRIALAGGTDSYFRINADGRKGPEVSDVEIAANDSIYVFVTVQINPTQAALPFIIEDSLRISFNGNDRWVKLSAWGQNANFLRSRVISADTVWTNDKPIVIIGGLLVAEGRKLTIQKGTRIYLHADAPLLIDGTLTAVGEKYDSTKIIFQGDRLDKYYKDLPGAWPGIYFRETSKQNTLEHVIVKNAYQGIVTEKPTLDGSPKLTIKESIISDCYDAGLLGVASSVKAVNCLISNCGRNILLALGGEYEFIHCTDVAVSNNFISHKQPVLALTDFIKQGDVITVNDMKANFVNCIFWGSNGAVDDEVITVRQGGTDFTVNFSNCLWKVKTAPEGVNSSGMVMSDDPLFQLIEPVKNQYDFHLLQGSPAIDAGINVGVMTDIEGNERLNIPDIGAFESMF